ncbi:hypothetical protein B0H13DRAFT_2657489 [Mycena leptocephala]|nr:hypothetical protein B0H13DRAFT_2657489 [Mycena leptocephala]
MDYKKKSSKLHRKNKREEVQEKNGTPGVKVFHLKLCDEALGAAIQVDFNIDALPHSEPAWIGKQNAQDDHTFEDGMGGRTLCLPRSFLLLTAEEPGELQNNKANTQVTDELLADESFQHLIRFANVIFRIFAPILFLYFQTQMMLLEEWKPSMVWNTAVTVFAACTFNFGPHALTVPHLDFGNLSWGWCVITALGRFNPDLGGHLILWDLKLVI